MFNASRPMLEIVLNFWRTARMLFTRGDRNWRHNVAWRAQLFWPVAMFLIVGIMVAWKRQRSILLWLVLGMVPAVIALESPHALRAILMLPAACLLAAMGANRVYEWLQGTIPARAMQAIALIVGLGLAYEPYHTYFNVWVRNPQTAEAFDAASTEIARKIAAAPADRPKLVIAPNSGMLINGLPVSMLPQFLTGSYTDREQREKRIRYVTADRLSVWAR